MGWTSYLELAAQIDEELGIDLEDELVFGQFCEVLRRWYSERAQRVDPIADLDGALQLLRAQRGRAVQ